MRPIKFRGLSAVGIWYFGSLYLNEKDEAFIDLSRWQREPVHRETVGEFTGLHDKNGKEIYEGDIIKGEYLKGLVCFGKFDGDECDCHHAYEYIGWFVKDKHPSKPGDWDRELDDYASQCEVLGNVHENPELLK